MPLALGIEPLREEEDAAPRLPLPLDAACSPCACRSCSSTPCPTVSLATLCTGPSECDPRNLNTTSYLPLLTLPHTFRPLRIPARCSQSDPPRPLTLPAAVRLLLHPVTRPLRLSSSGLRSLPTLREASLDSSPCCLPPKAGGPNCWVGCVGRPPVPLPAPSRSSQALLPVSGSLGPDCLARRPRPHPARPDWIARTSPCSRSSAAPRSPSPDPARRRDCSCASGCRFPRPEEAMPGSPSIVSTALPLCSG